MAARRTNDLARHEPERTCIVTRAALPAAELIRFVLGPDGAVVPDLKRKLPGRGVWVTATPRRRCRRRCKRRLFARAFKAEVEGSRRPWPTTSTACCERTALQGLSLANKAGRGHHGFAKVEAAIGRQARRRADSCDAKRREDGRSKLAGRCADASARPYLAFRCIRVSCRIERIGFGIGPGKCDTCCARRGRGERMRFLSALASLPLRDCGVAKAERDRRRSGTRAPADTRRVTVNPQDLSGMSDTNNTGDKTLHVPRQDDSALKRPVEQGMVRQSFSHGRSQGGRGRDGQASHAGPGGSARAKAAPPPAAAPAPARRPAGATQQLRRRAAGRGRPRRAPASCCAPSPSRNATRRASALADARAHEEEDPPSPGGEARRAPSATRAEHASVRPPRRRKREDDERRRHEDERKRAPRISPSPPRRRGRAALDAASTPAPVPPTRVEGRARRRRASPGDRGPRPREQHRAPVRAAVSDRPAAGLRRPSAEPQSMARPARRGPDPAPRSRHPSAAPGCPSGDHRGRGRRTRHPPSRRCGEARDRAQGAQGAPAKRSAAAA